jgi:dihydrofolate reductase
VRRGTVYLEMSMSLDGFITGPNVGVGNGMGDDGDRLHDWKFGAKTETDAAIVDEIYESTGAVLIGKRMFDVGFEPWGDPPPFGMPVFVVTHEEREPLPMQGGTTYTLVTEGIEAALELARAAAGDKNVGIWGGANIFREYLRAGLLDEMQIHLIPILLGDGIRLFEDLGPDRMELRKTSSIETPSATHFRFEVTHVIPYFSPSCIGPGWRPAPLRSLGGWPWPFLSGWLAWGRTHGRRG